MSKALATQKIAEKKPTTPTFPLPKGHYFYSKVTSSRGHSGEGSDRAHVEAIQQALGMAVTGQMDVETITAVKALQKAKRKVATGVVDAETWRLIHS